MLVYRRVISHISMGWRLKVRQLLYPDVCWLIIIYIDHIEMAIWNHLEIFGCKRHTHPPTHTYTHTQVSGPKVERERQILHFVWWSSQRTKPSWLVRLDFKAFPASHVWCTGVVLFPITSHDIPISSWWYRYTPVIHAKIPWYSPSMLVKQY